MSAPHHFYPRPPRGGRPAPSYNGHPVIRISIHALREEGDALSRSGMRPIISFLSTPSARRATSSFAKRRKSVLYFYPRPPRGGRRGEFGLSSLSQLISIHALREEGDTPRRPRFRKIMHFYPRPPRGGRQQRMCHGYRGQSISIHALREEGDLRKSGRYLELLAFLSTPSARRATVSIDAGGTFCLHFYPRPPRGGRPEFIVKYCNLKHFYPRPPRGGRRALSSPSRYPAQYFYPRPPRGGRLSRFSFKIA